MNTFLSYKAKKIKHIELTEDGVLTAKCSSKSFWLIDDMPLENQFIQLEMRVDIVKEKKGGSYLSWVYFLEEGMADFDEEHRVLLSIISIGDWHTYQFKASHLQKKKIVKLRFHPVDADAEIGIRNFEICEFVPSAGLPMPTMISLSYFSRSGSTLVMKILTSHPKITGFTEGTYDAHVMRYFLRFAYMIKNSFGENYQLSGDDVLDRLGQFDWFCQTMPRPVVFPQHMNLKSFDDNFRLFLDGFIPGLLQDMAMPHAEEATYYVEKHSDSIHHGLTRNMMEIFPDTRIIVLFRDPRDVFLSLAAYAKTKKIHALGGDIRQQIDTMMTNYRLRLEVLEQYGENAVPLYYEELMTEPHRVMTGIFQFLGLESTSEIVDLALEPMQGRDLQASQHVTAGSARNSLARWKNEMSDELVAIFMEYGDLFQKLGYEI